MMNYISRVIEKELTDSLHRGKSILLLGARQTGKTTLLKHFAPSDLTYTLLNPEQRLRFEKSPSLLTQEITAYRHLNPSKKLPLVVIDEVQKLPALMDEIQLLIDDEIAQFILTGSSVRKLRRHPQFNLLPGRVINLHLDPFNLLEIGNQQTDSAQLEKLLIFGSLPKIYLESHAKIQQIELEAYVTNYLQEEVRGEALVRQLGSFARFLELAAIEAGNQINMQKLSQELGISRQTMVEYFEVLEDCLIAERIDPLIDIKTRRRLTKAPKYLFFDMGIRRVAALEGAEQSAKSLGNLFEQWVGLELLRYIRTGVLPKAKLRYWRDHAGPEVDYVLEFNKQYLPIEVKWTAMPTLADAKHLKKFMQEYACFSPAYIICRTAKPFMLAPNILALPWHALVESLKKLAL